MSEVVVYPFFLLSSLVGELRIGWKGKLIFLDLYQKSLWRFTPMSLMYFFSMNVDLNQNCYILAASPR